MKLRTRILLTAIVLLSVGFYLLIDWIVRDVRFHYFMPLEESLVDTSILIAQQLSASDALQTDFTEAFEKAQNHSFDAVIYGHTKTNINLRVVIVNLLQEVQFDSRNELQPGDAYQWRDARLTLKGKYGARATYETKGDADSFHFYVGAPIIRNGELVGAVSVGKPVRSIYPFMKQARRRLIICALIAFCSLLLLYIPLSLWIIHPVRSLTRYARAIRDGNPMPRPTFSHKDEMAELATAFEEMRDALEGKQYVETYVQSLTHELKSPLSAIQGAVELLNEPMPEKRRAQFLTNIRTESDRLHDLVERVLSLAAIEKQKELAHAETLHLPALIEDVLDSLAPLALRKQISFTTELDPETKLHGEYFLLRQAVANLVRNAIDFSFDEGSILIQSTKNQIQVCDSGAGIPLFAVERIFERFYSLPRDNGPKSSGLGLNFVQEIARLHGGSIELCNQDQGGTKATLTLPTA